MRAGPLNKVLDILKYTVTTDTYGEEIITYTLIKTTRASISGISGTEKFINAKILNEVTKAIEIRYDSTLDLNPKDIVEYNNIKYDIISIINFNEKNEKLLLLCIEHFDEN